MDKQHIAHEAITANIFQWELVLCLCVEVAGYMVVTVHISLSLLSIWKNKLYFRNLILLEQFDTIYIKWFNIDVLTWYILLTHSSLHLSCCWNMKHEAWFLHAAIFLSVLLCSPQLLTGELKTEEGGNAKEQLFLIIKVCRL